MLNNSWSEQKEKHLESKTKSYQPRRTTSDVVGTLKNLLGNPPDINDKYTEKIINSQLGIKLVLHIDPWQSRHTPTV